jgi:hypothetical protein
MKMTTEEAFVKVLQKPLKRGLFLRGTARYPLSVK